MNNGSSKTLTKSGRFEHVSRNTRVLFHFFFSRFLIRRTVYVSFLFFFFQTSRSRRFRSIGGGWSISMRLKRRIPRGERQRFVGPSKLHFVRRTADRPSLLEHKSVCSVSSVARSMICVFCYAIVHMLARRGKTRSRKPREGHVSPNGQWRSDTR